MGDTRQSESHTGDEQPHLGVRGSWEEERMRRRKHANDSGDGGKQSTKLVSTNSQ